MRKVERVARLLERTGAGKLARRVGLWRGVLVLNYHRLGAPDGSGFDRELWSATAEDFDAQVRLLARDFDVVGPADVEEGGGGPSRRVLITFDDGYRDNHEIALPVLRAHGVTSTFFVVPGFVDWPRVPWWDEIAWIANHSPERAIDLREYGLRNVPLASEHERRAAAAALVAVYKGLPAQEADELVALAAERAGTGRVPDELARELWMTWDQIRDLAGAGMTIGGHSLTHPVLARLPPEGQAREIDGCAERLREELGIDMRWFSYPVGLEGTYDRATRDILARAGVRLAFTFSGGYAAGGVADPLAVPRAGVSLDVSRERFGAMVTLPRVFARW